MDLVSRFKKDYFNYLISIIFPALITGVSVPILKHLLGTQGYGNFSIYYNATLIVAAISTGWITQSIFRFYPMSSNKMLFAKITISISGITQLLFFLPVFLFVLYSQNDLLLGLLICMTLFITSTQFSYMAIVQSSFLSKKTIYSETIRAFSYMAVAVILLSLVRQNYLYELFIALIISFTLSVIYLRKKATHFFSINQAEPGAEIHYKTLAKQFLKYGTPLSMWIVFAYLVSYIDKIMMLKNMGPIAQGNYQAIFDLLSRGLTVLISPVIISLFPLLTLAYEKGEIGEIKYLLKKILLLEAAGFVLASILYWTFGANLLFMILKIPGTTTYRWIGFIVIAGTFLWQMAMVVHERYVLKKKTFFLLCMITAAFSAQAILYWIFRTSQYPLLYPLGYLFSAVVYLFFVSFSQLRKGFKSIFIADKALIL